VELPVGGVVFHTHPNACLEPEHCFLEVPSEADWRLLAEDASKGTAQCHVVVSRSGLYVMAPGDMERALLVRGQRTPQEVEAMFRTQLEQLDDVAVDMARKGRSPDAEVRRRAIKHARGRDYTLRFVPWGKAHALSLRVLLVD